MSVLLEDMLIKGAKIVDPSSTFNGRKVDVFVRNGKIEKIEDHERKAAGNKEEGAVAHRVVEASGLLLLPGLVDMHVHLREPGHEYKETIESGCRAAVSGGFTAVCAMPNTNPVNDNADITGLILSRAAEAGCARVWPAGAISVGSKGEALCEYPDLKNAGAVAVTDDGFPVKSSRLMRSALECAKKVGLAVISHCEDIDLVGRGVMNEGPVAVKMGLAGIPNACESIMVMRDIALAELADAPVHIAHVSTEQSVHAIRDAKARGIKVTAETAPHYFALTERAVEKCGTHAKMNPPLRSERDRQAICAGLSDGTIDAIATDHAPHGVKDKDVAFDRAANGVIGLETSLPLSLELVRSNVLSMEQLVEKMALNPSRILGLDCGIAEGKTADMTLVDPELEFVVVAENFHSKSRNTPFEGWNMKGRAKMTIVGGKTVYEYA